VASTAPRLFFARASVRLIEQRPGLTVAGLAEALGVGMTRVWQMLRIAVATRSSVTPRPSAPL
jgi:hypothetical protein